MHCWHAYSHQDKAMASMIGPHLAFKCWINLICFLQAATKSPVMIDIHYIFVRKLITNTTVNETSLPIEFTYLVLEYVRLLTLENTLKYSRLSNSVTGNIFNCFYSHSPLRRQLDLNTWIDNSGIIIVLGGSTFVDLVGFAYPRLMSPRKFNNIMYYLAL